MAVGVCSAHALKCAGQMGFYFSAWLDLGHAPINPIKYIFGFQFNRFIRNHGIRY